MKCSISSRFKQAQMSSQMSSASAVMGYQNAFFFINFITHLIPQIYRPIERHSSAQTVAIWMVCRFNKDSLGLFYFIFLAAFYSFSVSFFLTLFTTPTCSHPPLIIAGWLSFFQQSFSGSLINCLLSVCGVGHSVLHTFTLSAGLFSAASLESLLQKLW